jgi:hypothetical protein
VSGNTRKHHIKNEHRNSRSWYVPKGAEDTGVTGPIFLIFIVEGVFDGLLRSDFFLSYGSSLSVLLFARSMTGPIGRRVLSYYFLFIMNR